MLHAASGWLGKLASIAGGPRPALNSLCDMSRAPRIETLLGHRWRKFDLARCNLLIEHRFEFASELNH